MTKILVVTYGGGHARMLRPVIDILLARGFMVSILALNTAAQEFENADLELLGYRDFFSADENVKRYGECLAKSLEKVVNYDETVCYLGQNFLELVERYGEDKANEMYLSGGRYIFEPRNSMKVILKSVNPDFLLTTNSPRSEKCAILAARELGIKSAAFVDMFGIRCSSWFKNNDFANKVFVLSDSVKRYFIRLGRNSKDIVVTGNPAFDSLVKSFEKTKAEIREAREASPFTVLWASQPEPSYLPETGEIGDESLPIKIEESLLDIFKRNKDWKLIVRNHPSELKRDYPDFVDVSTQKDDFGKLLSRVHVVLTPSSTVGFQGIILGTRLVTIDLSVLTPTMPYAKMGFSRGLDELDSIEPVLFEYASNRNDAIEPAYRISNAAEKAVNEIVSVLEQ